MSTTVTSARFTDYAKDGAGRLKHTVTARRYADGWTLALRAAPVQPVMPPVDLPATEFFAAIAAQSTVVATREVPLQYVGDVEVRPSVAALALTQEVLGTAWTVVDNGNGFVVEIR